MPIILLSILLVTGMANAATLTPVGTCVSESQVSIALNVDDVTGIYTFDITVTPTGLTATTADVSFTESIAANWTTKQADVKETGAIQIIANGGSQGGTTGSGKLATITFTATDGKVDTETVSVTVKTVPPGVTLTPSAYTPVVCGEACSEWADVITKYNAYVAGTATWTEVIACYNAYVAAP